MTCFVSHEANSSLDVSRAAFSALQDLPWPHRWASAAEVAAPPQSMGSCSQIQEAWPRFPMRTQAPHLGCHFAAGHSKGYKQQFGKWKGRRHWV